jgi:hypothetical protein
METIPDAGFLFSVAALNASFAGLAGLLVGLRSGSGLQPLEALRLRQVVEFAFSNVVLALSVQPSALLLEGVDAGMRVSSGLTLVYVVAALVILRSRVARVGITWGRSWAASAIGLSAAAIALSSATIVVPSAGFYDLLLVAMLARPMAAFLLVLGSMDDRDPERAQ